MATIKELPEHLSVMIETVLEPGEHIVWTGQPRMTESAFRTFLVTVLGLGLGCSFAAEFASGIVQVILLCSICIGWVTPAPLMYLWRSWALRNTCYVITSRRAIAFIPGWDFGYRIFVNHPEDLASVRTDASRKRFGSIVWVDRTSSQFSWLVGSYRGAFTGIDHPGEVLEIMYDTFLPLLGSRLKDLDPDVRRKAVSSLAKIGVFAKQAVPHLLAALESDDSFVRSRAAQALGQIGDKAKPAIPALKRTLLTDESRNVAETARKAIDKIDRKPATQLQSAAAQASAPASSCRNF
ncbi:MAG: HEAT repeat domain-containing protein [Pirellulaceae bacterium]|jgi:hypothetical protein|nr:HEAT repeat domain-containing protein [Pirellulaceae bacterium]MDP7018434.1 HEAT repeat domain-containing protein [Pirellulaceae bacterium]